MLADELRPQHQSLDPLVSAIDLLFVARQADRLDDRTLAQRLPRTFDFQVLDRDHAVAIR